MRGSPGLLAALGLHSKLGSLMVQSPGQSTSSGSSHAPTARVVPSLLIQPWKSPNISSTALGCSGGPAQRVRGREAVPNCLLRGCRRVPLQGNKWDAETTVATFGVTLGPMCPVTLSPLIVCICLDSSPLVSADSHQPAPSTTPLRLVL